MCRQHQQAEERRHQDAALDKILGCINGDRVKKKGHRGNASHHVDRDGAGLIGGDQRCEEPPQEKEQRVSGEDMKDQVTHSEEVQEILAQKDPRHGECPAWPPARCVTVESDAATGDVIGIEKTDVVEDQWRIEMRDIEQGAENAGNDEEEPCPCPCGLHDGH